MNNTDIYKTIRKRVFFIKARPMKRRNKVLHRNRKHKGQME